MSATTSPSSGKTYGVVGVCEAWSVSRSTYYDWLARRSPSRLAGKRGPKPKVSDAQLEQRIRSVLRRTETHLGFHGEGHRKVWARLRHRGIRTSKSRVLRIMREGSLLAPQRSGGARGPRSHDGKITTERPDVRWGTDATQVMTREDGLVWVFAVVDHCASECIGVHASVKGSRHEALVPLRDGVREHFGSVDLGAAKGLELRHDNGSQFSSKDYQRELEYLGIHSSPSYVRAPEGNGVVERFNRTMKEQLLWIRDFRNAEDVRVALLDFKQRYNANWLVNRHGYRTPNQVRHDAKTAA